MPPPNGTNPVIRRLANHLLTWPDIQEQNVSPLKAGSYPRLIRGLASSRCSLWAFRCRQLASRGRGSLERCRLSRPFHLLVFPFGPFVIPTGHFFISMSFGVRRGSTGSTCLVASVYRAPTCLPKGDEAAINPAPPSWPLIGPA